MSLNSDIPKISITSETENEEQNNVNFIDDLTDVEDLNQETNEIDIKSQLSSRKRKLRIKLTGDKCTTDIEDFETSDLEENDLVKYDNNFQINNIDLKEEIFKETHKINTAGEEIQVNTEHSNVDDRNNVMNFENDHPTDEEYFDTDNELPETSISDIHFDVPSDLLHVTSDMQNSRDSFPIETLNENRVLSKNSQILSTPSTSPHLSDFTDTEILNSDSESEAYSTENKCRRRYPKRGSKYSKTDDNGVDMSEKESERKFYKKMSKNKNYEQNVSKNQALHFDSDNECKYIPFPICKTVATRNNDLFKLSGNEKHILTDTEEVDIEIDNITKLTTNSEENLNFEKKLNDISAAYSNTEEKNILLQKKNKNSSDTYDCLTKCEPNKNLIKFTNNNENVHIDINFKINKNVILPEKYIKDIFLSKSNEEALTESENMTSSDEELRHNNKSILMRELENSTDEDEFEDSGDNLIKEIPDIELPAPSRNLIILKETKSLPTVKILPLNDELVEELLNKEYLTTNETDDESYSESENYPEIFKSDGKIVSPELPLLEGGIITVTEDLLKKLENAKLVNECVTDTEDILLENQQKRRKAPKFKHIHEKFIANKNKFTKPSEKLPLTDTEYMFSSDDTDNVNFVSSSKRNDNVETDYLEISSEEDKKELKIKTSFTPSHINEVDGEETVLFKEGLAPFSPQDRIAINRKIKTTKNIIVSPANTDTEEIIASADEEFSSYSRAETTTPNQVHRELDEISSSNVHAGIVRKYDTDMLGEVMYLKGGSYVEYKTDSEDISEDEYLNKDLCDFGLKFIKEFRGTSVTKQPQNDLRHLFPELLQTKMEEEWDATRKPAEPEFATLEKDAAQQDISSTGPQFITYESVLLTPKRNMSPSFPDPQYLHKTTSYTQIDAMLEKMLNEVEKQEKLFSLDLDILEPTETCVNTIELVPSSDAVIEVPIKKSIKKPKIYETMQEINISNTDDDASFEFVSFNNNRQPKDEVDHQYDLISFDDSDTQQNFNEISKNIDSLVIAVEEDEANLLLSDDDNNIEKSKIYKIDFERAKTASSESLTDNYPDSWNEQNEQDNSEEKFIDDDYELIENRPLTYAYQLHDNRTGNDIWWEGTYRNLSIVPEEDEENLSLLSSCYSNKAYITKPYMALNNSFDITENMIPTMSFTNLTASGNSYEADDSTFDSSSIVSTSSDEGTYETCEKIVKAEVKLLVKTSEKGKEQIEIRSVREFMDDSNLNLKSTHQLHKVNEKSKTLPNKISEKFSNISNKFSNLLEKKKSSSYSFLPNYNNKEMYEDEINDKPSFTLQRLFVRNPDIDKTTKLSDNCNLSSTKELSKSKTELLATSNEHFPLEYNPETTAQSSYQQKVDLYANIPFYPCYNKYPQNETSIKSNPFTEFISSPLTDNTQIPQAYCDWLPQKEDFIRGKTTTTTHSFDSTEDISLVEKPVCYNLTGLSTDENHISTLKTIYDQTNALIQSESRAEPYDHHTEKYYKTVPESGTLKLISQVDSPKGKKQKKGLLGTIKTFVGKSIDLSDSESEKSPKKEKKAKKEKKKKSSDREIPTDLPVRPPRKPKLPTPTEDRKYADIPYFESSPETPVSTHKFSEIYAVEKDPETITSQNIPITDLDDADLDLPHHAKEGIKQLTKSAGEISISELKKSPKPKKEKIIIVEEKVSKTFAPASVEEEEFTIIIDPTKKGSPKKTRETFTLSIDQSIEKIEKEILEKSPILPDEKLIKPIAQIEAPVRPSRMKEHLYEDIEEPIMPYSSSYLTLDPTSAEIKTLTNELIQNEINFAGWADDKHNIFNKSNITDTEIKDNLPDSQKMKRKHGKFLSGLFSKFSKDFDDSDEDSKKEVIEKHDKETSKEQEFKTDIQKSPKVKKHKTKDKQEKYTDVKEGAVEEERLTKREKSKDRDDKGFLGLFKKGKKDETETKQSFSEKVIKDMIDSTAFLKEEIDKYHDVRLISRDTEKQPSTKKITLPEAVSRTMEESEHFLNNEIEKYHDVILLPIENVAKSNDNIENQIRIPKSEFAKHFEDKSIKSESTKPFEITTPTDIKEIHSSTFLKNETEHYHDMRPVTEEPVISAKTDVVLNVETVKEHFKCPTDIFQDNTQKVLVQAEEITEKPNKLLDDPIKLIHINNDFLKTETEIYHDVRPIIKSKTENSHMKVSNKKLVSKHPLLKDTSPVSDKTVLSPKIKESEKSKKDKEGKGLFGLFKSKKHEETEDEAKEIIISDGTVKNMQDTDSFLKDEVDRYYDEKPQSSTVAIQSEVVPKELKNKSQDISAVLKIQPDEINADQKINEIKVLSDTSEVAIKNLEDTNIFLKSEVELYHDVHPVLNERPTDVLEIKSQDDKSKEKGFFSSLKQKISKEKDIQKNEIKPDSTPLISTTKDEYTEQEERDKIDVLQVIKNIEATDVFLRNEVENFHDVHPVIATAIVFPEKKDYKPEDGEEFFSTLEDKSHKVDIVENKSYPVEGSIPKLQHKEDIIVISDIIDGNHLETADKIQEKLTKANLFLSETAINSMKDSELFLKMEVDKYNDVKAVALETVTQAETTQVTERLKDKKGKKNRFGLFGKKSSKERDAKEEKEVLKNKKYDLKQENEKCDLIKDEFIERDESIVQPKQKEVKDPLVAHMEIHPELKTSVADTLENEFKSKQDINELATVNKENITETSISKKRKEKDGKGLFGRFKRKSSEESDKEKDQKVTTKIILSDNVIKQMKDSDSFLKQEVEHYHDVRSVIKDITDEKGEVCLEHNEKQKGGLLDIFKKKRESSEERDKGKEQKGTSRIVLSDNTIRQMNDSSSFLKDEVEIYHDVRPIIKNVSTETEKPLDHEEIKKGGLFGIFKKKRSSEEREKVKEKIEVTKIVLSESAIKQIKDTDSFLNNEVDVFHDVRPIIKEVSVEKKADKSTVYAETKKESLFDKFKPKKKGSEEEYEGNEKIDTTKITLSDGALNEMKDTDSFLKNEVDIYHDVHRIVLEQTPAETKEKEPLEHTEIQKESLFKIFKKGNKSSEDIDRDNEQKVTTKVILSENAINQMKDTDSFLSKEVEVHHDVRPLIIKEIPIENKTEKLSQHSENQERGFLELFKTKKKGSEEMGDRKEQQELSENTINEMKDSESFLNREVEVFHDVRPIIKNISAEMDKTSLEHNISQKGGLFDIFKTKKDDSEERDERKIQKEVTKVIMSEETVNQMKDTDSFLGKEVEYYHDVRPIVTEISLVHKTEKSLEHAKVQKGGLFNIFKTKGKVPVDKDEADEEKRPTKIILSENAINQIKDSDSFLNKEVEIYHDVRPVVGETYNEKREEKPVEHSVDQKGRLFDIFKDNKKCSEESENEKEKETKIVLSENAISQMNTTDCFLNNEVKIYHDVRPIIRDTSTEIKLDTKSEQNVETKVGLLGIFKKKKKGSEERDEEKEPKVASKIILSENVINQMKSSDSFLKKEIDVYHDVRPIIKDISNETKVDTKLEQEEEKKGLLSIFKKKKKGSEEREVEKEPKVTSKIILSENVINQMKASDSFLKKEVDVYHDVRPIIKATSNEAKVDTKLEQEEDKKPGLLDIFKKKKKGSKERDEEKEPKVTRKIILSENVINQMKTSDSFLKKEVDVYHDVRPIIKATSTETKVDTKLEQGEDKKVGLLSIFKKKKKGSEEREVEKEPEVIKKIILSENVINQMKISDSFLKKEVDVFHDVRPIIKATSNETKVDTKLELEEDKKTGLLDIFKKKKKGSKERDEEKEPKVTRKIILSENVINQMKTSDTFLKKEVDVYHDVRPIIKATSTETKVDTKLEQGEDKKVGLLGIFKKKKKGSEEREVEKEPEVIKKIILSENVINQMKTSDSFLKKEVDVYHDVRPIIKVTSTETKVDTKLEQGEDKKVGILGIFKKKKQGSEERVVEKEPKVIKKIILSENVINQMKTSDSFLKKEVDVYHDVRPIIKATSTETKVDTKLEQGEDKKVGLLGMFKKKKKGSEERDVEKEPKIIKKIILSENVINQMKTSDSFLKQEVDVFHDVRPIIKATSTETKVDIKLEQGEDKKAGLLGIVKKKKKGSEEREVEKEPKVIKKIILSENANNQMKTSDSFLKQEVDVFHDVRPIIKAASTETKVDTKLEQGEDKQVGLLGIFKNKKKGSEEREVEKEPKVIKKIILSENVINQMKTSDSFLKKEVDVYHDVRPIIKDISNEVKVDTKLEQEEDKKVGLLGIFKKKKRGSEEREVEKEPKVTSKIILSENVINQMKTSESFLKKEVDVYHDVRPIIKDTSNEAKLDTKVEHGENQKGGLFSLFKKKKKDSEERDEEKEPKVASKIILPENVIIQMKASDVFLKKEVDVYHDVRPIIKDTSNETKLDTKLGLGEDKKVGLFGLFKKKTKGSEKRDEEKEPKVVSKIILPENTINKINESDSFLKKGVDDYHDVRPITTDTKSIETKLDTKLEQGEDQKVGLFGIFKKKKKGSGEKDEEKVPQIASKISLSEETINQMKNSDSFLKKEVDIYHDVRPIIKDLSVEKTDMESEKGSLLGLFKKGTNAATESNSKEQIDVSISLENAGAASCIDNTNKFLAHEIGDYYDARPIVKDVEGTILKKVPSFDQNKEQRLPQIAIESNGKLIIGESDPVNNVQFVEKVLEKTETIEKVKPVSSELPIKKLQESDLQLKNTPTLFDDGIFNNNILQDSKPIYGEEINEERLDFNKIRFAEGVHEMEVDSVTQNIHETTNFINTELERYEDSKYTIKKDVYIKSTDVPTTIESVAANTNNFPLTLRNTENFIREEINNFHDVWPIIKLDASDTAKKDEEKISKSRKLFGLFGKKKSLEKDSLTETEKKSKKKSKAASKTDIDNQSSKEIIILDEDVSNVRDSKDFTQEEVDRYQDSEREYSPSHQSSQEGAQKEKSKSGGFLGLFSKKSKPQGKTDESIGISDKDTEPKQILSPETLKNITVTGNFLRSEVDNYHDAKPQKHLHVKFLEESELSTVTVEPTISTKDIIADYQLSKRDDFEKLGVDETNILADLSNLDDEINERLKELRDDIETIKPIYEENDTEKLFSSEISKPNISDYTKLASPVEIFGRKQISHEDDTKEKHLQVVSSTPASVLEKCETKQDAKFKDQSDKSDLKNRDMGSGELSPLFTNSPDYKYEQRANVLSEDALKQMQNAHNFLTTEIENYEDGRTLLITDLDDDSEKIKSSGLFNIFSRKSESPKPPKRKFKKHKVEKTSDETIKSGLTETPGQKTGTSLDVKDIPINELREEVEENILCTDKTVGTEATIVKETNENLEDEFDEFLTDLDQKIKESTKDANRCLKDTVNKTNEKFMIYDDNINRIENEVEKFTHEVHDPVSSVEKSLKDSNKIFISTDGETEESKDEKSKESPLKVTPPTRSRKEKSATPESIDKIDKKNKKSFFTKLGQKIGVKSEDKAVPQKIQKDIPDEKVNMEKNIQRISQTSIEEIKPDIKVEFKKPTDQIEEQITQENLKDETSSFVTEIMQSFNDKLEQVRDVEETIHDIQLIPEETIHDIQLIPDSNQGDLDPSTSKIDIEKTISSNNDITLTTVDSQTTSDIKLDTEAICQHMDDVMTDSVNISVGTPGSEKKSGGFFSKLSDKIGVKSKDVKKSKKEIRKTPEVVSKEIKYTTKQQPHITDTAEHTESITEKTLGEATKHLDEKVNDITDTSQMRKQEEEVAIAVQNVENAAKTTDHEIQEINDFIMEATQETTKDKGKSMDITRNIKQMTMEFIEAENLFANESNIPRTTSDYGSNIKEDTTTPPRKISEANIDLSNLPKNFSDYYSESEKKVSSYVTSPTMARRAVSQRLPKGERPELREIANFDVEEYSDDEFYIVTEPPEIYSEKLERSEKTTCSRKPMFHLESEEDENIFSAKELERSDSAKSNVLETLTDIEIDSLVSNLTKNLSETMDKKENITVEIKQTEKRLEEHKKESQAEVDLIEKKLSDLDKALNSLEQIDLLIETDEKTDESKTERKLRRVERKFERMASEVIEKDAYDGKQIQMTSPEVEETRENEYHVLVSQLSTEEISDFQKDYSQLWDEHTFSKTEDWESKTPDSQADAQELPQGDIVYMGPVNLNKDNLINKAGIEVDVIPIMRSPCPSPIPKKKNKRAKSEMGFYKDKYNNEDDRGSLPDLKSTPFKGSLLNRVMQMKPDSFLSNESLVSSIRSSEQKLSRSMGSSESIPKGAIMNAVVHWLQKSSPFSSTDNIDHQSMTTSIPDTMDISMSIFDEDDLLENSAIFSDEKSLSKSDQAVPDILISAETTSNTHSNVKQNLSMADKTLGKFYCWSTS